MLLPSYSVLLSFESRVVNGIHRSGVSEVCAARFFVLFVRILYAALRVSLQNFSRIVAFASLVEARVPPSEIPEWVKSIAVNN